MITSCHVWISRREVQFFLGISGCFFCLGLILGGLGPALLELARRTKTHVESVGAFASVRGVGYVAGTISGGSLLDYGVPVAVLLGFSMTAAALATCFLTLSYNFSLCLAILFFQGLGMGVLDSGGNVALLWAFRDKDLGPYLQSIHFFFALGSCISPLIVGKFMAISNDGSNFNLGYYILAASFVPLIAYSFVVGPEERKEPKVDKETAKKSKLAQMFCSFTRDQGWVILLTSIFLCFYVGAEASTGTLIYTYVVKKQIGGTEDGYLMTFVFWGAIAIGRLAAVPLSAKLSGMTMLLMNLIGCLLSPIIILIWPSSIVALWIGITLYGIAMASSFPTAFVVAETMMEISGSSGSGVGEVVIPVIVSELFGTSLSYSSVVVSMLVCAVIGLAMWCGYLWKYKDMERRGQLPSQIVQIPEEDNGQHKFIESSRLLEESD